MSSVQFESLERRTLLSVSAVFVPATGVLNVTGDNAPNAIVVSRDAAGKIFVNGGVVNVSGGASTVANTESILNAFDNADYLRSHAAALGQITWTDPSPVTPADLPTLATRARKPASAMRWFKKVCCARRRTIMRKRCNRIRTPFFRLIISPG